MMYLNIIVLDGLGNLKKEIEMKKLITTLIISLSLTSLVYADQNAALQMRLAGQTKFQQRVAYILMQEAFIVLGEATNVPNHVNRFAFAVSVRNNVNSVLQGGYVIALVGRPNLVAETTTCDDGGLEPTHECVTSATDAEIASQIATDWDLWSNNQ